MADTVIMRFVDIMLCFPSFFLILTVVALLPASIYNIMIVIGLTSWEGTTRFVRAEFLSLREQDFVAAARALGVDNLRIIFRHMVPNAVAPVLVSATIGIVMGGLAGFYGRRHIRLEQLLVTAMLLTGAGLLAAGLQAWGALLLVRAQPDRGGHQA